MEAVNRRIKIVGTNRYSSCFALIVTLTALFAFATFIGSNEVRLVLLAVSLLIVLISPVKYCHFFLFGLIPNLAIFVTSSEGLSFVGVFYCILFVKMLLTDRMRIQKFIVILFVPILFIGLVHFINTSNYYDIAIAIETAIILSTLFCFIKNSDILSKKYLYTSMQIGMYMSAIILGVNILLSGMSSERMSGLLDNANYTAIMYCVFILCEFTRFIHTRKKTCLLSMFIFAVLMFATGSRGALLSLAFGFLIVLIFGWRKIKLLKFTVLVVALMIALMFVFYFVRIPFFVDIYDNLIGRTLEKLNSNTAGKFMDVSSGRITLWKYYFKVMSNNQDILFFGSSMNDYYMKSNGGFGFYAHNVIIGSIMGVGVVGTLFILVLYFMIFHKTRKMSSKKKFNLLFISIPLSAFFGYLFLDGIFDIRLLVYLLLPLILYCTIACDRIRIKQTKKVVKKVRVIKRIKRLELNLA